MAPSPSPYVSAVMESDRLSSYIFECVRARTPEQIWWSSRVVSTSQLPRLKRNYRISFKDPLTCILKLLLASHTRAVRKMRGRMKFNYRTRGYGVTLETVCGYIYHKYALYDTYVWHSDSSDIFVMEIVEAARNQGYFPIEK